MHDDMVQRVAVALREELQNIGYGVGTINAGQLADTLSRVAIEAMREPTAAMVIAGLECKHIDLASEWRAMIDHVLSYPGVTGDKEKVYLQGEND